LAVPVSVAVSSIGFPSTTVGVALVEIDGVTGVTTKHSVRLVAFDGSATFGTPGVVVSKFARQQYLPADVIVAAAELYIPLAVTGFTFAAAATAVPPVWQFDVASAIGPQRCQVRVPVKVPPDTLSTAESVAVTEPPPIERPPAGIVPPLPFFGVVTIDAVHAPSWPRA
jgi:hypothetical protein